MANEPRLARRAGHVHPSRSSNRAGTRSRSTRGPARALCEGYSVWRAWPAATLMAGLIRSGQVDLDHFEITAFALDRANEAVAHAAGHSGPFRMTVIQPR